MLPQALKRGSMAGNLAARVELVPFPIRFGWNSWRFELAQAELVRSRNPARIRFLAGPSSALNTQLTVEVNYD